MRDKLEELLYDSLAPMDEPDPALNRQILEWRSKNSMKKHHLRKTAVAVAIACVAAASGFTAYAAYHYLSPSQIADEVSDNGALAKAFEGKDAICINETQTSGKYNITLLGLVSGEKLSTCVDNNVSEELEKTHTYATLAIARTDGKAMGDENKCVSPLINGVDWMVANNATLDATLQSFEQDGITYELLECDNLEIFAGRGVQIGIVDQFGNENSAFTMDAETGKYRKNTKYEGTNALFDLPLDASGADERAAEKYIRQLEKDLEDDADSEEAESETDSASAEVAEEEEYMARLSASKNNAAFLRKNAVAIKGSKKVLQMDEEGCVDFIYKEKNGYESKGTMYVADQKVGKLMIKSIGGDETLEGIRMDTFTLNKDGTVTYEVFKPVHR